MCIKRTVTYTVCTHTQTVSWIDCAPSTRLAPQLIRTHKQQSDSISSNTSAVPSLTDTAFTLESDFVDDFAVTSRCNTPPVPTLEEQLRRREGCPKFETVNTGSYPLRCPECADAGFKAVRAQSAEQIAREMEERKMREQRGIKSWEDRFQVVSAGGDAYVIDRETGRVVAWGGSAVSYHFGLEEQREEWMKNNKPVLQADESVEDDSEQC